MGKLIAIVGNCGTGKTTLAQKLAEAGHYQALLEQHRERPFQQHFSGELRTFSLANQMDYLLFRAEQELRTRQNESTGVQDGGLEQDFHVFTKLFQRKGYLDGEEFRLCERLYGTLRQLLPPPDLYIKLSAPVPVLVQRRAKRERELDIVRSDDLEVIEDLMREWWAGMEAARVIELDTGEEDPTYERVIGGLIEKIGEVLKK